MRKLRIYKLVQTGLLFAIALGVCISGLAYGSRAEALLYFQVLFWMLLFISLVCILADLKFFSNIDSKSYDLRRTAYVDHLTGVMNRTGMDLLTAQLRQKGELPELGCAAFQLTNLFETNDTKGHDQGDRLVRRFAMLLTGAAGNSGYVCRNNAITFFAVIPGCDREQMDAFLKKVAASVQENNKVSGNPEIAYRCGSVLNSLENETSPSKLFSMAYRLAAED